MARTFRFYQKKRGNRRTGSQALGSAGEALFFAAFLFIGCVGVALVFATLVVPEWQVNYEFVENTCVVLDKDIKETQGEDGTLYRPVIQIKYEVKGAVHQIWTYDIHSLRETYSSGRAGKEAILDRFTAGEEYPCWHNPANPEEAVLERGYSWWAWLILIVPVSFILVGGGGLVYGMFRWGKSAERRAAIARRAANLDPFDVNGRAATDFPNVPKGTDIINSPGTTLAFRLPVGTSPAWAVLAALLVCLFWNGIVSVFVVVAVNGHMDGDPDWFLTLFIIPFVLVGIALIFFFFRQLLVSTGVGPTLVEISAHPLRIGGRYRLFCSQHGRLKMNSLEVLMVCEEEATYRQGTDTRTETQRICQQRLFRREGFEIRRGLPFAAECDVEIPAGAMHSFKSDHNEVNWKLIVKGDVAGWPDYERSFPVIVHPTSNGREGG